jgi:hypothetical protein
MGHPEGHYVNVLSGDICSSDYDHCLLPGSAITVRLKSKFQAHDPYAELEERPKGEMPSKEVMKRWFDSKDDLDFEKCPAEQFDERNAPLDDLGIQAFLAEPTGERLDGLDDGIGEDEELTISGFKEYRKLISNDPGYIWLLGRLHRDILLSRPEEDTMNNIGHKILQVSCPTRRVSRKKPSTGCKVTFCVEWNAFAFLAEQDIEEGGTQSIANTITVTGSCRNAQALSCREYLAQTWPSTGTGLIEIVQQALLADREDGVDSVG